MRRLSGLRRRGVSSAARTSKLEGSDPGLKLELGLDTFGDVTAGADGQPLPHAQVIRNVVEEAVLADQVGVDFIGVGEHHRDDFAVSAPEVVLAAIAGAHQRASGSARPSRC